MRRLTALTLMVLFSIETAGCHSWHQDTTPLPKLDPAPTTTYRITLSSGRVVELTQVHVQGDSLLGIGDSARVVRGEVTYAHTPMSFPVAQVTHVERRSVDAVATTALVGIIVGTIAVIGAASAGPDFSNMGGGQGLGISSCPLIYSWNGDGWHLDSGTFGGAITPALARTDLDNLRFARGELGLLQFRMTDESNESEHVDAFAVVAVDHPAGTDVAPDARANDSLHVIGQLRAPISARDYMNREVLAAVRAPDGRNWESTPNGRNPDNPAHLRDGLELSFARPGRGDHLQLVVDAQNTEWAAALMGEMVSAYGNLTRPWYDSATSAAASLPMTRAQHNEGFLQVSVWTGVTWRPSGEIWEAGPEVAKRQVLPIDASGIRGDIVRVRLESAPMFWRIDYVGLGAISRRPTVTHSLPTVAVTAPRDRSALQDLGSRDGKYLDMERGDTVSIIVRDTLAAPAPGTVRSYLARTSGWYRIHGRDDAAPDFATLAALADGPHGAAKLAVQRMNQALRGANTEKPIVPRH